MRFFNHLDKRREIKRLWSKCFLDLRCLKTLTRRSWHPSEWPIFDTKTFVSNFAASTVITNLLPGQKKIAKLFAQKSAGCCCRIFRWPPQALWRRFFSNQLNIILIVYKPKEMIIWTENDVSFFIEVLLPILLFFFQQEQEQNRIKPLVNSTCLAGEDTKVQTYPLPS